MLKTDPIYLRLPPSRGRGVSIQAVISSKQRGMVWRIDERDIDDQGRPIEGAVRGNTAEAFRAFVTQLLAFPRRPKRTVLVMDNAKIHLDPESRRAIKAHGISILWLPSSSSELVSESGLGLDLD